MGCERIEENVSWVLGWELEKKGMGGGNGTFFKKLARM